ncbi:MAG TPA: serine hydrolase domain-containing protein [Pyrinomonadaceae bacterium]|nr:serine hydrolase domain-containing protein [Pyrinomonadaceae bacterium]
MCTSRVAFLKTITALITLCLLSQAHFAPAQTRARPASRKGVIKGESGAKLDRILTRYTMYGFSGTVLVAQGGKIILNRGYGLADRKSGAPNTEDSVFAIGSLTKQFTAAAILQLEDEGKLRTQDLASKYLGEFPQDKAAITLHHLLTHTSGLISDGANARLPLEDRDEYIEAVKRTRLRSQPGEKFYYSNVGYNLLAAIVEKVSGLSFEDYLQQRLFKPAGMKSTGFINRRAWNRALLSIGYEPAAIGSGSFSPGEIKPSKWDDRGAGGVLSTTTDLYRWHLALEGGRILSSDSKRKLYTPFLNDYAYGWEVRKTKQGTLAIQHGGDVPGFQSWLARFPEEKLVVVMLINNRMRWRSLLTGTLVRVALGETLELPPPLINMDASALNRYVGVYQLPTGGQIHAWQSEGAYFIGAEGQDATDLLTRAGDKERSLYQSLNERATTLFEKFRRGEFEPLREFLGATKPAGYVPEFQQWWQDFERNNGALKSYQILGTARSRTGHAVTFIRVTYERATKVLRLLWFDDKLDSYGSGVPRPAMAQYLPESPTQFTSFDILTSQLTSVRYDLKENGMVENLIVPTKNGEVKARRIQ